MKTARFVLMLTLLVATVSNSFAQYYYKDIVSSKETAEMMKSYLANKVTAVRSVSYDGEGVKSDAISVAQTFSASAKILRTEAKAESGNVSVILSYINDKGQVIKTVDSSEFSTSLTTYQYNASGQLQNITSSLVDSTNTIISKEEHQWQYKDGKVSRLLRIKNGNDTAFVQFKLDEAGNVTEERLTRRSVLADPFYYYYDAQNRLTDIVRYNNRVKKLLPETMFEYSASNQVIQRISVPAVGSKYLIWRYQYDDRGLKIKEAIYDRYKQLNGKVEYLYSFGY